jgi:gluconokinase
MAPNKPHTGARRLVVIMGVEGVGKTTVGRELAAKLGVDFVDGDDEHSPEAKARMSAGIPLDDDWRVPWLDRLNRSCARTHPRASCSRARPSRTPTASGSDAALPMSRSSPSSPREVLEARIAARHNHFAGLALLDSQLQTLELGDDVATVDATKPVDEVVAAAVRAVS